MLQAIFDTIFSAGTIFGIFFILLGVVVFLKTIEKMLIFWFQMKQKSMKKRVPHHE
jgi:hypothetical protein